MGTFRTWVSLAIAGLLTSGLAAQTSEEYRVKAGFLRNFIAFTEWPEQTIDQLPICVYGQSPITDELRALKGMSVGGRDLQVREPANVEQLAGCRVVFVAASAASSLSRVRAELEEQPVLIVAESKGALDAGAAINLFIDQSRVAFAVNLATAHGVGLKLSSKMLRLAAEVRE